MSIAFLADVMSEEGIATDPTKVKKICNLSAPKDKGGDKKQIGTRKLLQELLCNNTLCARTVQKVGPLQVG